MKTKIIRILAYSFVGVILFSIATPIIAQENQMAVNPQEQEKVVIVKNDGTRFVGFIISRDIREVIIETENIGQVAIPLHEIREIRPLSGDGIASGEDLFSTRYFLTTNGLSMRKGQKYAILNWFGPEAHFAVADGFTIGAMTTWVAMPLIGSAKVSFSINENFHIAIGGMVGTLSWANFGSVGGLGYGAVTLGNSRNNITLSGGIAGISEGNNGGSAPLLAPAMLISLSDNLKFVLDSFIYLDDEFSFGIVVPGLRFGRPYKRSSFQFGLGAIFAEGEVIPLPIPVMSWFFDLY